MPQLYTNGTGATVGGRFVTAKPLLASGNIWYVHFGTGTDAVSPAGKSRVAPLKTIVQAVTNAASGDAIVLLDGHDETVSAVINLGTKDLFLFGEGTNDNGQASPILRPTAGNGLIDCDGRFLLLSNVRFLPPSASTGTAVITDPGYLVIDGCRFESDGNLRNSWVFSSGATEPIRIRDTVFVSTATAASPLPRTPIFIQDAVARFTMENCTIDGGSRGFERTGTLENYGLTLSSSVVNVQITGLRLLGTGLELAAGCRGHVQMDEATGSAWVDWPAAVSLKHHPGGLGGTGHALIAGENLITTATTRYVDPVLGNNSSSGLSRDVPLLTIAQALTNGIDGDIIVLVAAGHADNVALNKRTILVGDSVGGTGLPSLGIAAAAANPCVSVTTVDGSTLLNLALTMTGTANALSVATLMDDVWVDHCLFTLSGNGCGGLLYGATCLRPNVRNCTFSLVGSADTTGPAFGLDADTGHAQFWLEDCVFESTGEGIDAGVTTSVALKLNDAAATTILTCFGLTMTRARAVIGSFYDGLVNAETSNGGTVDWL